MQCREISEKNIRATRNWSLITAARARERYADVRCRSVGAVKWFYMRFLAHITWGLAPVFEY